MGGGGGGGSDVSIRVCVCVCVHALFVVGLMLHHILVPGGGLTLKLKVNIHVTCTYMYKCWSLLYTYRHLMYTSK